MGLREKRVWQGKKEEEDDSYEEGSMKTTTMARQYGYEPKGSSFSLQIRDGIPWLLC